MGRTLIILGWKSGGHVRSGKVAAGKTKIVPFSFDDLIARFYRSSTWESLKPTTREVYRGELERFREKYGNRSAVTMTARHISSLLEQMGETPSAANNLKKRLGQLFRYAILQGWRTDNPATSVHSLKVRPGGHKTWQEEQIAAFEARHPVGTRARLAFDLALYTAQRKSDVRVMGPQHVERGKIRVKQLKTGKVLLIPIHPALAMSIAATPTGHLAYIISNKDAPFTIDSFGMWFGRRVREAGLSGYSMHGLRKAASRRMAELGLSNQLIKSITGHTSDVEVARYTRDAEQERMADEAFRLINLANPEVSVLANPTNAADNA